MWDSRNILDTVAEKFEYNLMYVLYNVILLLAAAVALPYYLSKIIFAGKYRKSIIEKFGGRQTQKLDHLKAGPRIWVHAVSVGEVTAAAPIVAALKSQKPEARVVFSTSTETGQEMARKLIKKADALIYYPLDFPCVVKKMLEAVRPDVFVAVETELWPNFLRQCAKRGVKTLMVNGRISPRSYKRYYQTRWFWRIVLRDLNAAAMISEIDAERFQNIGMAPEKMKILGNAKYDGLAASVSPLLRDEISRRLNVREGEKYFVAGSTHEGEEDVVIDVYRKLLARYPDLKLIIVPRHIERTSDVMELLRRGNLTDVITLSDINAGRQRRDERIVVVDVIGELFKVYALADVVFCGGSLVPKGGQNILEAAAWGKVIFYGPSMEDFSREKDLLEQVGCGNTIHSSEELLDKITALLDQPEESRRRGEKGREVVLANIGAAARYADFIAKHF